MFHTNQFSNIQLNKEYISLEQEPYISALKNNDEKLYQKNLLSNILKEKHLSRIGKELSEHGITEIALLKGIYLLKTLYADKPWIRSMSDIDILVKKEDYTKSKTIISSKYHIKKKPLAIVKSRHQFGFYVDQSFIEIHRSQTSFNRFNINYNSFFEDASECLDHYGTRYILPSFEKMALFSIIHNFSQNISELDIRRIIETEMIIQASNREKLLKEFEQNSILHLLSFHSAIYSLIVKSPKASFTDLKIPKAALLLKKGKENIFSSKHNKLIKILLLLPSTIKWSTKAL